MSSAPVSSAPVCFSSVVLWGTFFLLLGALLALARFLGRTLGRFLFEQAGGVKPASSTEQTYEFRRFLGRTLGRFF